MVLKDSSSTAFSIINELMGEIVRREEDPVEIGLEGLFQRFIKQYQDDESDGDFINGQLCVLDEMGVLDRGSIVYFFVLNIYYHDRGKRETPKWAKLRKEFTKMVRILGGHETLVSAVGSITLSHSPSSEIIQRWKEVNGMPAKAKSVAAPAMKKAKDTKTSAKKSTVKSSSKKSSK